MIKLKKQIHWAVTAVFYKATHYEITEGIVLQRGSSGIIDCLKVNALSK